MKSFLQMEDPTFNNLRQFHSPCGWYDVTRTASPRFSSRATSSRAGISLGLPGDCGANRSKSDVGRNTRLCRAAATEAQSLPHEHVLPRGRRLRLRLDHSSVRAASRTEGRVGIVLVEQLPAIGHAVGAADDAAGEFGDHLTIPVRSGGV